MPASKPNLRLVRFVWFSERGPIVSFGFGRGGPKHLETKPLLDPMRPARHPPAMSDRTPTLPAILIVDDDIEIRSLLERYLKENGFVVRTVANGQQMDGLLARERFACIVLDLMMPGEDGLSICRRLRADRNDIPIIMLTARGDDIDRIVGLEMGADDYLAKPFNPRELLARINALLRRRRLPGDVAGAPADGGEIVFADVTIDLAARTLSKAGALHRLTTGEFALLSALTARPGRPLSRERLLELTQPDDPDVSDRSIDLQVHRLRRLVEDDPSAPRYIQTVRGHGYVFVPDGAA
jgi:two-component system, OmpR family, phosphate regulon response regulator OmpR